MTPSMPLSGPASRFSSICGRPGVGRAAWCRPILEQLARERAGALKVVKVNVDVSPQISARYRVQGIPTLLLLDRGRLVDTQVGALPAQALSQWLDAHLACPAA